MSVNFYNKSLKRWHGDDDKNMKSIFKSGIITAGDSLQQMRDNCYGTSTPANDAKSALLGVISVYDKLGHSTRVLLQNTASTN